MDGADLPGKRASNQRPRDVNNRTGTDHVPSGKEEQQDYDSLPDSSELTSMGDAFLRAIKNKNES